MEIAIIGGGSVGLGLALNLEQRSRPFGNIDDCITQEELRALSDQYKRIAGYSTADLATGPAALAA